MSLILGYLRNPSMFTCLYADGAYVLYRVDYIKRGINDELLVNDLIGYWNDSLLSLMPWNHDYPSISIPEVVASFKGAYLLKEHDP